MNVFLVEDSHAVRNAIRASVERAGGRVIGEAAGQTEAIHAIEKLSPDVVVLDLHLEEGNGINVMRAVKKSRRDLVVAVLTGQEYAVVEGICRENGADFVFEKSAQHLARFVDLMTEMAAALRVRTAGGLDGAR
jgi:DNA-binding NarL/FixJ family response regulator